VTLGPPDPPVRHSTHLTGTTHTERFLSGFAVGWAIALLLFGCFWLLLGIEAVADPSSFGNNPPNPAGAPNGWGEVAFIAGGAGLALLAIRLMRTGVKAGAGKLTIYNMWRTRVVNASDIRAINLEEQAGWTPRVHLADETSIWLGYFSGARVTEPPKPRQTAKVDRLRLLLGVAGDVLPVAPESL